MDEHETAKEPATLLASLAYNPDLTLHISALTRQCLESCDARYDHLAGHDGPVPASHPRGLSRSEEEHART